MNMIEQYAELVIKKGVNLRKGQPLAIGTTAGTYYFARELGKMAYKLGAQYVRIDVNDANLTRARLENQNEEELTYVPEYSVAIAQQSMDEDWAKIAITASDESDLLEGVDPKKIGITMKSAQQKLRFYQKAMMAHKHPWTVIAVPTEKWAKKVLGPEGTIDKMWEVLKPIIRLDQQDPIKAWDQQTEILHRRCKVLNDMKIDTLHFVDEGTDLRVKLNKTSQWIGGPKDLPNGDLFMPNIPTEEVFTTPDPMGTEGYVTFKKPVDIMGNSILGGKVTFKDGKAVESSADEGAEIFKEYLNTDEGARYLGEVALVDQASPIAQSNLLFHTILYDENAACHIALGAGYPICLSNNEEITDDESSKQAGCNVSMVHTDCMISSSGTTITATTVDGEKIVLMENGLFTEILR